MPMPPEILKQLSLRPPATPESLSAAMNFVQQSFGCQFPKDYVDFLSGSNGAVGHGPNLFVTLDAAEEIERTTQGYGASEFAPGLIVIGSDGCGNLLGIDARSHNPNAMNYVWLDLVDWNAIQHRAESLSSLLVFINNYFNDHLSGIRQEA